MKGALEAHHLLGKVLLVGEANTGHPGLGLWVEALEEAEDMLLLNQLGRGHALELLAKIIAANLSLRVIEQEEDMLLLILDSGKAYSTLGIGLITEAHTLGEVGDRTVVTGDFGHVVSVLEAC